MEEEGAKIRGVIKEVIASARQEAGGDALDLVSRLKEMGIKSGRNAAGDYSPSIVSKWLKGRVVPPADVVLAAAIIGRFNLDDALRGPGSTQAQIAQLRDELRSTATTIEKLARRIPVPPRRRPGRVKSE